MKKICLLFLCLITTCGVMAESLKLITPPQLLKNDATASRNAPNDRDGKKCAAILVDIVGVHNLKFVEAVSDVKYSLNEYIVYVPAGTRELTYIYNGEKEKIEIDTEIESAKTYRMALESDNSLRSIVFHVAPNNATVSVKNVEDGKSLEVKLENGAGVIDIPKGSYICEIQAKGYESKQEYVDTKNVVEHISINLESITYSVSFTCNAPDARIYIDNEDKGTARSFKLPEGKHSYRVVCSEYKDEERTFNVTSEKDFTNIQVVLKQLKSKTVRHSNERTKSETSMRNHWDFGLDSRTYMEDAFKSGAFLLSFGFTQYTAGILTFREGIGVGGMMASDHYSRLIDKYYYYQKKRKTAVAWNFDVPLQTGITLPLSKYNTSFVSLLGGIYGSYYYNDGHSEDNIDKNKLEESNPHNLSKNKYNTAFFDGGLRFDAIFYINKFMIGFEYSQSLLQSPKLDYTKKKVGTYIGVNIGMKFNYYKSNRKPWYERY